MVANKQNGDRLTPLKVAATNIKEAETIATDWLLEKHPNIHLKNLEIHKKGEVVICL